MLRCLACLVLVACFEPGDLPPLDRDVPIVGLEDGGPCAPPRDVDVACVIDGDTLDVQGCGELGDRVRLLGIDAPELAHEGDPAECYGEDASAALRQLADRRQGVLTFDAHCTDVYGRALAYLWLPADRAASWEQPEDLVAGRAGGVVLVNEWLLDRGFARRFADEGLEGELFLEERLDAAERAARADERGLYTACVTGP